MCHPSCFKPICQLCVYSFQSADQHHSVPHPTKSITYHVLQRKSLRQCIANWKSFLFKYECVCRGQGNKCHILGNNAIWNRVQIIKENHASSNHWWVTHIRNLDQHPDSSYFLQKPGRNPCQYLRFPAHVRPVSVCDSRYVRVCRLFPNNLNHAISQILINVYNRLASKSYNFLVITFTGVRQYNLSNDKLSKTFSVCQFPTVKIKTSKIS